MLYRFIRFVLRPIIYVFFRPEIYGLRNFPMEGKTIVFSNHTSMMDPIVLGCILPRQVFFMAKAELFKYPILGWVLKYLGAFPVKRGTADLSAIKNSLQVLKKGKVFGIFPEGTRNREGNTLNFSHGVASIAHKSKAKTIPIAITGGYKLFKPIKVIIGEPLDFEKYFQRKSNTELFELMAREMEEAVNSLMKK